MKFARFNRYFFLVIVITFLVLLYIFRESNKWNDLGFVLKGSEFWTTTTTTKSEENGSESSSDDNEELPTNPENVCNYEATGPRILCAVFTHYGNLATKAKSINMTWGNRCDKTLYVIGNNAEKKTELEATLPVLHLDIKEQYHNLSVKTFETVKYVHKHLIDEFDWLLKADDDTYVIMDNLRYFLSNKCPNENKTYGYNFNIAGVAYHSGGGGYALSRETVRQLAVNLQNNASFCSMREGYEDMEISKCLKSLNITPGESRDKQGRERFHCISFKDHWEGNKNWIESYSMHKVKYGADCCSKTSITFHYVNDKEMLQFDYLIYQLKAMEFSFNHDDYFTKT